MRTSKSTDGIGGQSKPWRMCSEYVGRASSQQSYVTICAAISASLDKDNITSESVTNRLLQEHVSQQVSKSTNNSTKNVALVSCSKKRCTEMSNNKETDGNGDDSWYCGKPGRIKSKNGKEKWDKVKSDERKNKHEETIVAQEMYARRTTQSLCSL